MLVLRHVRFDLLVTIGCTLMLAFFAWHAWFGMRGFSYLKSLDKSLIALKSELAEVDKERVGLVARVVLMRPESVDPDMLEELARRELNWLGPTDFVVALP